MNCVDRGSGSDVMGLRSTHLLSPLMAVFVDAWLLHILVFDADQEEHIDVERLRPVSVSLRNAGRHPRFGRAHLKFSTMDRQMSALLVNHVPGVAFWPTGASGAVQKQNSLSSHMRTRNNLLVMDVSRPRWI
jgi:hypothetical protein